MCVAVRKRKTCVSLERFRDFPNRGAARGFRLIVFRSRKAEAAALEIRQKHAYRRPEAPYAWRAVIDDGQLLENARLSSNELLPCRRGPAMPATGSRRQPAGGACVALQLSRSLLNRCVGGLCRFTRAAMPGAVAYQRYRRCGGTSCLVRLTSWRRKPAGASLALSVQAGQRLSAWRRSSVAACNHGDGHRRGLSVDLLPPPEVTCSVQMSPPGMIGSPLGGITVSLPPWMASSVGRVRLADTQDGQAFHLARTGFPVHRGANGEADQSRADGRQDRDPA